MQDKLELKQRLLAECLRIQKEVVANARRAMEEAQQSAMEHDDTTEDTLVDSYREEMQNKRDMFARQMEAALDDLALLNKVQTDKVAPDASFGAVVKSELNTLFVSISLGKIVVDGSEFFAVSPAAPIFKAMAGKKAGESFPFRDKQVKVLEVF